MGKLTTFNGKNYFFIHTKRPKPKYGLSLIFKVI